MARSWNEASVRSWAAWFGLLIRDPSCAKNTRLFLFSDDLRTRLIARLVMWFSICLFATVAALPSVTNESPTSMLPSLLEPWSGSLDSLWRKPGLNADDSRQFERRQSSSSNAFDHNPNGSEFLWVLQDTYQGDTFFECVEA